MENKTLQHIEVSDISPNPYNPRMVFDQVELDDLKKSISKVGILVPLTVYKNTKNFPKTSYILLDGERRWRCAKELGMETVPANVIDEPEDITQNILFMFNIHHYRKEWALFPTALKLEVLMEKLGTDQESTLSNFTGVSRSMIRRCKTLLWFPYKYRNILMEKGGRISTDFFIETYPIFYRLSNEDEYSFPDGVIRLIDGFIDIFLNRETITDVKEFREIRKAMGFFDKTNNFSEFKNRIEEFLTNPNSELEVFASGDIEEERTRKNISKYLSYLNALLPELNPDLVSDYQFVEQLQLLEKNLSELLEKID